MVVDAVAVVLVCAGPLPEAVVESEDMITACVVEARSDAVDERVADDSAANVVETSAAVVLALVETEVEAVTLVELAKVAASEVVKRRSLQLLISARPMRP